MISLYIGYYTLNPTVSLIQALTLTLIVLAAILAALGAPKRLLTILLALIAASHAAYIAAYKHAYNLHVTVYPLLDLLQGPRGPSLVLDLAQLSILTIAAMYLADRAKKRKKAETI
jgi:hypothetical protein